MLLSKLSHQLDLQLTELSKGEERLLGMCSEMLVHSPNDLYTDCGIQKVYVQVHRAC